MIATVLTLPSATKETSVDKNLLTVVPLVAAKQAENSKEIINGYVEKGYSPTQGLRMYLGARLGM
jgi:hypothetical protein